MPEIQIALLVILTLMLVIISIQLIKISSQLAASSSSQKRTSMKYSSSKSQQKPTSSESHNTEMRSGSDFEKFLREDPLRQSLPKEEQFKAYRKWRTDNGMNWTAKK